MHVVATLNSEHPLIKYRVADGPLVDLRDDGSFVILTGPSPWGTGLWGPFPADAIVSHRPPTATDSWPVSGCPSERWTYADLRASIARARRW